MTRLWGVDVREQWTRLSEGWAAVPQLLRVSASKTDVCRFPTAYWKIRAFHGDNCQSIASVSGELQFISKAPMGLEDRCDRCRPTSTHRGINPCQWGICNLMLLAVNWKSFHSQGMWVWLCWQSPLPSHPWAHRQHTHNNTLVNLESTPHMSILICEFSVSPRGQFWPWILICADWLLSLYWLSSICTLSIWQEFPIVCTTSGTQCSTVHYRTWSIEISFSPYPLPATARVCGLESGDHLLPTRTWIWNK